MENLIFILELYENNFVTVRIPFTRGIGRREI